MNQYFARAGGRAPGWWRAPAVAFLVAGAMTAGGPAAAGGQPGASDAPGALATIVTTSGHGGYVSAGVGLRDQGHGTIEVTGIPPGATITSATLLWDVLDDSPSAADAAGVLDGQAITGTQAGSGPTPCWNSVGANYSFAADVTSLVGGNGGYALTGFASGDTDGHDPWNGTQPDSPLAEGASLVVIYADADMPLSTFQVAAGGAETHSGNPAAATLGGFTAGPAATVTTTFIVADGQYAAGSAAVNGDALAGTGFPGAAPQAAPPFSYGSLWDNTTANITAEVRPGDTSVGVSVTGGADCLVWVGQVLDVAGATVLGLGDSVAAGYGIGPSGGDTPAAGTGDNPAAYPYVLARKLGGAAQDYAVAGACADDAEAFCRGRTPVPVQLAAVRSGKPWFTPTVVTLTVGADDIYFSKCASRLLRGDRLNLATDAGNPCTSSQGAPVTLARSLGYFTAGLRDDLRAIQHAYPGARILVMDYDNPFAPPVPATRAPCALSYGIVANRAYRGKGSIAAVVSMFVLHFPAATAAARGAQDALHADAAAILSALNGAINGVAAGLPGVTVIKPASFAGHDACADGSQWVYAPRMNLALTYVTYAKEPHGPWKAQARTRRERFNLADTQKCPRPAAAERGQARDIRLTDSTGRHQPGYALSLTLTVNCFPYPTPLGQERLASAFYAGLRAARESTYAVMVTGPMRPALRWEREGASPAALAHLLLS